MTDFQWVLDWFASNSAFQEYKAEYLKAHEQEEE